MFSGIWAKVAAFFAAIFGIALIAIKMLAGKNKELKREVEIKEKEIDIRVDQDKVKSEIINDEKERVEKTINKPGSRADRLNRL